MASYTHEYSNFPESTMKLHQYKDVDNATIAALIQQIKAYQIAGKYAEANNLINTSKDVLAPYMLTSEAINAIEEETRNLEIYAQSAKQQVYYQVSEPIVDVIGSVWIG